MTNAALEGKPYVRIFVCAIIVFAGVFGVARQMPPTYLEDVRRAKAMGFTIEYDEEKCSLEDVATTLHGVLEIMENDFPKDFFKKGGLRRLIFQQKLTTIDGFTYGGLGGGGGITLQIGGGMSRDLIAHEMYHVFSSGANDSEWCSYNHRDFIYKQQRADMNFNYTEKEQARYLKKVANSPKKARSYQIERELGRKALAQIARNDENPEIQSDFVSGYAQTNTHEDRAETFAKMYCEQEDFFARTAQSETLRKKMIFIQKETKEWLGSRYWRNVTEYGNDPKVYILSAPTADTMYYRLPRVTIPRTILDEKKTLVEYKDLKGKIKPGLPVERIMKRLRADIDRAVEVDGSVLFMTALEERKKEALLIVGNILGYKGALIACAKELKERGDTKGVEKTLHFLINMWPTQKEEWLSRFSDTH